MRIDQSPEIHSEADHTQGRGHYRMALLMGDEYQRIFGRQPREEDRPVYRCECGQLLW